MRWHTATNWVLGLRALTGKGLLSCALFIGATAQTEAADMMFVGGHIYTADASMPSAEALVVSDDTIVFVGSREEAEAYRKPSTRIINTEGKMVMPGFHDAHLHTFMGGRSLLGCDLAAAPDLQAVEAILSSCLEKRQQQWLVAEGLNLGFFGQSGPELSWLDSVTDRVPMLLRASDGHSVSANTLGLEMAQISRETEDPPAGIIERDELGAPSGTFRESAMSLLERHVPTMTEQDRLATMRAAITVINQFGITSAFDAWVSAADVAAYRALDTQQQLSLRVRGGAGVRLW